MSEQYSGRDAASPAQPQQLPAQDRVAVVADLVRRMQQVASPPTQIGSRPGDSSPQSGRSRRQPSKAAPPVSAPHPEQAAADAVDAQAPGVGKDVAVERARAICLNQLAAAPRTREQLSGVLARREVPADVAGRVLDRLTEVGLIDDLAYARAYVRTKHRDRGLGRQALGRELRRQGIDPVIVDDAVVQLDEDDERRRAEELVNKRLPSAWAAGPDAARRRLLAALDRRGYPAELAHTVVSAAIAQHTELSVNLDESPHRR